jgi:DNA uptake protein ComE-like DNA-binding protein
MKTADLDELDELPEVGAVTAETMVEYRRTNGMFRSVEELASMRNRKTSELRFRALLPRGASEVELTLA